MMTLRLFFVFAILLATVGAHAEDFKKLGLEDKSSISPFIEKDTKVKVEGISSIKISTKWPVTICIG